MTSWTDKKKSKTKKDETEDVNQRKMEERRDANNQCDG